MHNTQTKKAILEIVRLSIVPPRINRIHRELFSRSAPRLCCSSHLPSRASLQNSLFEGWVGTAIDRCILGRSRDHGGPSADCAQAVASQAVASQAADARREEENDTSAVPAPQALGGKGTGPVQAAPAATPRFQPLHPVVREDPPAWLRSGLRPTAGARIWRRSRHPPRQERRQLRRERQPRPVHVLVRKLLARPVHRWQGCPQRAPASRPPLWY